MNNGIVWTEKYRPKFFNEIIGNYDAVSQVKFHINDEKRAIILHGNPGVGKTTLAYVIANEMNLEVIELNASDQRTGSVIKKIVGASALNKSFDDKTKLIILDEADNLHGNSDKGGAKAIIDIIKKTKQPIILTANELYKMPLQLRNICNIIELKSIGKTYMFIALGKICDSENVNIDTDALNLLVENSNGDLRSAINDLQSNAINNNLITKEHLVLSDKYVKDNIFKRMQNIFNSLDISNTYNLISTSEKNPEEMIQWIEQNLSLKFKNDNIYSGYEYLSKADVFLGRVRRRQNYKMWKYTSALLSCLNSDSLNSKHSIGFVRYQSPQHWKILKNNKKMNKTKKDLFIKLSKNYHISSKHIITDILPFLIFLMQNKSLSFSIENELTKNEISYLLFQKPNNDKNTNKIINDLFEMSQHDIKINKAEEINTTLDSTFDINSIDNINKKIKKSKEELKIDKLDKKQFSLDDF